MAFESLSESYKLTISGFPPEWLPLTYLYDPDLPLFPIAYFHIIDPELPTGQRPGEKDRLFGFIHHINLNESDLSVTVIINKNLSLSTFSHYIPFLELEIKRRLGLENPVVFSDIDSRLSSELSDANDLVKELWYQVIDGSFGKSLPFGCMWDPVMGLARFVASWNSDGGRKGELISTHNFMSEFGVKIQAATGIHIDFYLLPTFQELTDKTNPLSIYPKYSVLVMAANEFVKKYCGKITIGAHSFSSFKLSTVNAGNKLNTGVILKIIDSASATYKKALSENFSGFDRGPQRSVISLMMLDDLRNKRWDPNSFTQAECGQLYQMLDGSYQTPKVIHLYAQQCFGNETVLPIDNWVLTFLSWPFNFKRLPRKSFHERLFACSNKWGKLERLIWIAAQSRKVHASVCKEILWCVRYGFRSQKKPGEKAVIMMRGASPFACKICEVHIRNCCPAYNNIKDSSISFNKKRLPKSAAFNIVTSGGDLSLGQTFERNSSANTDDIYSVRDRAEKFKSYPQPGHSGGVLKVKEFIDQY